MTLYRKLIVISFILLGLYAIIGFLVAPLLIRHFGEKALKENIGEASAIAKVAVNPFLWSLKVEGLQMAEPDGAWAAKVETAIVDLSALSLLKFYPVLDVIELDRPSIRFVRKPVIDDYGSDRPVALGGWREQIADLNQLEIPKVRIDRLEVREGDVDFLDETTGTPYAQKVESLSFTLEEFTTVVDRENAMHFTAVTETGASLTWNGIVTSQPITSLGSVEIAGLQLDHLSPYYEQFLRFDLKSAVFGMRFEYELNLSDPDHLFKLSEGIISLADVLCVPTDLQDRILSINTIGLEGIDFAFPQLEANATLLSVRDGETRIARAADGSVNLLGLLALPEPEEARRQASAGAIPESPVDFFLDNLEVANYTIIWEDALENGLASLEVGIPSFRVEGLSSDFEKPFNFFAEYTLGKSGRANVQGSVTPATQHLNVSFQVESVPLPLAVAYAQEFAQTKIESGLFDFAGQLKSEKAGVLELAGSGAVTSFKASREGDLPMTASFDSIQWDGMTAVNEPLSVKVNSITVRKPAGEITQMAAAVAEDLTGEDIRAAQSEASSPSSGIGAVSLPDVWIGSIEVSEGSLVLNDQSLEPQTTIEISAIDMAVKDFATSSEQTSTIEATAEVNGAPFDMNGSFYIGDLKKESKFQFKLSGLALPAFSSYSGQAIGRRIAKGRFAVQSDWTIVDAQLKANNQILIEQIELGDNVANDTAIRLPLDLAITLLKNPNGAIDVKLPLSGDLSDPKASVGQIVIKACIGLITNVAAAPFKLLSGLAGSEKDLSQVSFQPGDAGLSDDTIDSLNALAEALKKRPELKLRMLPLIAEADLKVLREAQARALFMDGVAKGDQSKFLKNLQNAYVKKMRASGASPDTFVRKDDPNAESLMLAAFLPDIVLEDADISVLSQARAEVVKNHLIASHAIQADRLIIADSDPLEKAETAGLRFDLE